MRKFNKEILKIVFAVMFFTLAFQPAFARRVINFDPNIDILTQVEKKIILTAEQLNMGKITNQQAAVDYLEMINLLHSLYHKGLSYSQFKSVLSDMEDALSGYYNCVYSGKGLVDVSAREQMILGSLGLDMIELLEKSFPYIRGKASQILEYIIPLLTPDSPAQNMIKNNLLSLMENGDELSRFYGVENAAKLVKALSNPAEQNKVIREILTLVVKDKDMLVVGRAIQSLHEVLKIVSIDNKFKDEIINKLISQYARLHTYPVKYYLTECLKYLVGSNPDKWWNKISEVLGKYQSIDRESILRYIFEKKKY